jgi:hypothetical protein
MAAIIPEKDRVFNWEYVQLHSVRHLPFTASQAFRALLLTTGQKSQPNRIRRQALMSRIKTTHRVAQWLCLFQCPSLAMVLKGGWDATFDLRSRREPEPDS